MSIIACAFLGGYIAKQKGRSDTEGVLFGALLGVIGLIILGLLPYKQSSKNQTQSEIKPDREELIKRTAESDSSSRTLGIILAVLFIGLLAFVFITES